MTNSCPRIAVSLMDVLHRSLLLLALCLSVCSGYLIVTPQNKVAKVGDSVELDCTTNDTVDVVSWYDYTFGVREVSGNSKNYLPDLFTIVGSPPSYNLQINRVEKSSAGRYVCGHGQQYVSAEVIAIEDEPVCWTNVSADGVSVEGDYLELTCSLSYSSSPTWAPSMAWSGPPLLHFLGNATDTELRGPRSAASFNSSAVIQVTSDIDGAMVKCLTQFSAPSGLLPGYAANDPGYSHSWYSRPLNVQVPPKDVIICPEERAYLPSSTITCFATSKPLSSYHWVDLSTNETLPGPSLTVPSYDKEGSNTHRYQCVATNVIKQVKHYGKSNVLEVKVVTDDKPKDRRVLILGGVLALVLLVLFLTLAGIIGYCRRVRKLAAAARQYQY